MIPGVPFPRRSGEDRSVEPGGGRQVAKGRRRKIGRRLGRGLAVASALFLAACELRGEEEEGMNIRFEDRAEPSVFERSGTAVRDRPDGAEGLWAAVPGLPRPERAELANLDTGDSVVVALFRAGGDTIRVSNAAAEAIGLGEAGAAVRVTALRSVPEIEY